MYFRNIFRTPLYVTPSIHHPLLYAMIRCNTRLLHTTPHLTTRHLALRDAASCRALPPPRPLARCSARPHPSISASPSWSANGAHVILSLSLPFSLSLSIYIYVYIYIYIYVHIHMYKHLCYTLIRLLRPSLPTRRRCSTGSARSTLARAQRPFVSRREKRDGQLEPCAEIAPGREVPIALDNRVLHRSVPFAARV